MGKKTKSASRPKRQATAATADVAGYERVSVDDLHFDAQNPRLVEYASGAKTSQDELLRILWEQMAVNELAMSIAASGYFEHEPLFVSEERGNLVVIEGNRRLAAVKLLRDEKLRKQLRATDLPRVSETAAKELRLLPVIRTSRRNVWQYIGFKHVNGPAKWDSYPKAQYVAQVHNDFGVPLKEIAAQIGDKHHTVQRLYRALVVIEQAEQTKVFDRENRYKAHFAFSHLYTGLDYGGIAEFIGLRDESEESPKPVPRSRVKQLGELCLWLYGDKSLEVAPVVASQNPHLRQLNEVLENDKAVASLRAGLPLSVALEVSYGDERVFHNALIKAKEQLQKARGTLSTGFRGEQHLCRLADDIADLACDLAEEMTRKASPRGRRRQKKKE